MYRIFYAFLSLLTLIVASASLYFQYVSGLQPCPLCLMQRLCVFILFFICITGLCLHPLRRGRLVASLQVFFALAGLYFSGRQLWLQSLPTDAVPACMPGLDVMMKYFPWKDVAHALFWGAGDCAEVSWTWLGLSMPAWSFLYFLLMFLSGIFVYWRIRQTEITGI